MLLNSDEPHLWSEEVWRWRRVVVISFFIFWAWPFTIHIWYPWNDHSILESWRIADLTHWHISHYLSYITTNCPHSSLTILCFMEYAKIKKVWKKSETNQQHKRIQPDLTKTTQRSIHNFFQTQDDSKLIFIHQILLLWSSGNGKG